MDEQLYQITGSELFRGVVSGMIRPIEAEGARAALLKVLRENVFIFSGFKTYQFLSVATDLLIDESVGKIRPFREFKEEILKIHKTYNLDFLRTEYNHAQASARMAEKWQGITETSEALPLLIYRDAGDARVRAAHQRLDGITLPVNHSFWRSYYPPNDYNCRCTVQQLASGDVTTANKLRELPELKEEFNLNVGTDKVVFPKSHPYYSVASKDEANARNNFGLTIPDEE